MKNLGIDRDTGDIYIGSRDHYPEHLQQAPVFPVKVFGELVGALSGPEIDSSTISEYVFQELSFDPLSQIRRGYVWRKMDSQPQYWGHPPRQDAGLITFQYQGFLGILEGRLPSQVMFTFGNPSNFTIGELVHFESDVISQELLTIKMRPQFGFLPRLKKGVLEGDELGRVETALNDVVLGYRSSPPASVIDRCRDALTVFLSIKLKTTGVDLGQLIKKFDAANDNRRSVVANLAHTVSRLHARSKPAETDYPPVSDRQAELAVGAVAEVLISLRWAEWAPG
ncbi:hypothetical protein [Marinobacter sp.]|uniref:hypothetical protein n=1 Tax=Marinobacter sp. TaxID=50741 RepID=UPI001B57FEE9|nr:hypothetical protein [Marinobacter sp.]MBQ0832015.1 hypothetical protein [Marinobacter sp.]